MIVILGVETTLIMKKTIFLFTFALSSIISSAQLTAEDMPGTWQTVYFATNMAFLSEELIEGGRKEALSTVYTFSEDGTFTVTSDAIKELNESGQETGTWKISGEAIILKYTDEEDRTQPFNINLYDGRILRLEQNMEDGSGFRYVWEKRS